MPPGKPPNRRTGHSDSLAPAVVVELPEKLVTVSLELCSDEELARQAQAGSLEAFEQLVYRYEGRIYGFISHAGWREVDVREITQDTFVRAFQAIAQYDDGRPFSAWLFTIARRKCIDHHRSAPRLAETQAEEPSDPDNPAEVLAREEDRQELWRLARRRLPESQFQALWLRYVEDLSVAEIAGVLRRTQTHVKVLLFRARYTLGCELGRTAPASLRESAALRPQRPSPLPCPVRKEKHAKLASQI